MPDRIDLDVLDAVLERIAIALPGIPHPNDTASLYRAAPLLLAELRELRAWRERRCDGCEKWPPNNGFARPCIHAPNGPFACCSEWRGKASP